ncbi:hypothetical protein SAMN05216554_1017 [Herbiconiux ginsengi]|uniref:Transposase DDE domain-containing protein n=1 Tax=Herbiconiux ginsengi TaxID=381665 RepID=A0A1H3LKM0_9MICO|nr:hypothetical protein SAMN05216554_1017 [Herbiconiux ginsengi]
MPQSRPDRVPADKGHPSRANRAWLCERGIAATIPERDGQIAHRRKPPGQPIEFCDTQRARYRRWNIIERSSIDTVARLEQGAGRFEREHGEEMTRPRRPRV